MTTAAIAERRAGWRRLEARIVGCERCARLRDHCRHVARVKRRAFVGESYWGKPVPGFGDRAARILLVGLAPAAHGANRTGRVFTGDRSGDWLYGALHRVGLANRAEAVSRDDGLELRSTYITAACRCAPPGNRPTPDELAACAPYLDREFELLRGLRVVVALGKIAWDAVVARARRVHRESVPRPRPVFGHGAETRLVVRRSNEAIPVLGTYHPSQQNTQTGRLTRPMLDRVLRHAVRQADLSKTIVKGDVKHDTA